MATPEVSAVSEERTLRLLRDLIRIKSVNPSLVPSGNGEAEIAHFLGDYMRKMGLEVRYQELGPARANVIGILKGVGGGKILLLNGHIDTVGTEGMDIDPLDPKLEDGKVYGRGSVDMKGGVAAMVEAVDALVRSGTRLRGDVIVTCVGDEEYVSTGTEAVVREYRADAAVNCEPSGLNVVIAHKGFAWIRIAVEGKAAHGSLPSEGVDAIVKAGHFLVELEKMGCGPLAKKVHPLVGQASVHASFINGGKELSTYPDRCVIELERRTIPGENRDTVEEEMEALLKRLSSHDPAFKAKSDVFFYRPPFEVAPEEPIVQVLRRSCVEVLGREPEFSGSTAWLDSAILKDAGIPTAIFGASGWGAHSAVEWVDFRSVVDAAQVLCRAISAFCA
jgi:acetylornithine deacetylase